MILLDTHVWIWWASGSTLLNPDHHRLLVEHTQPGDDRYIGVSIISCWEVAMLVSKSRLTLSLPTREWILLALGLPIVRLLDLTPSIAVGSTELPGDLHGDPADRLLVATAREAGLTLLTSDRKLREYPNVRSA